MPMPKRVDRYEPFWQEILVAATLAASVGRDFSVTIPTDRPHYTRMRFYGFREAARLQGLPGDKILDRLTPRMTPDGHGVTLTWVANASRETSALVGEQLKKYFEQEPAPIEVKAPAQPAANWLSDILDK